MRSCLLEVRNLSVNYPTVDGPVRAVRNVSFRLAPGQTLALVGETGCGKTTLALALSGLIPMGQIESGEVVFEDRDLHRLPENRWREIWGRKIGLVFQDSRSALNPVLTVGAHLADALQAHERLSRRTARTRAAELLLEVGIVDPILTLDRFPFELSGGMCQRIGIALGICGRPVLLIADEPTSALDATIQVQVLDLLAEMKRRHQLALLLISHDLALVSNYADQAAIMYGGRLVEYGASREVILHPAHPYTRALVDCLPDLDTSAEERTLAVIPGSSLPAGQDPPGCGFAPRCSKREKRCTDSLPGAWEDAQGHWAACIKAGELQ
jgi:oligopeptide/dipeptide ABC transporter ATP-binding protein